VYQLIRRFADSPGEVPVRFSSDLVLWLYLLHSTSCLIIIAYLLFFSVAHPAWVYNEPSAVYCFKGCIFQVEHNCRMGLKFDANRDFITSVQNRCKLFGLIHLQLLN
jgi:hypothetical protein